MADEKISALAAATDCANADLFVIVQGGGNKKLTKALLLTSGPSESLILKADAGSGVFLNTDSGDAQLSVSDNGDIGWHVEGNFLGVLTDGTDVDTFSGIAGGGYQFEVSAVSTFIIITQGAGQVMVDGVGNNFQVASFAAINIEYLPATSGDWSGDPAWDREAIDRLAAAVAGLLGTPIP